MREKSVPATWAREKLISLWESISFLICAIETVLRTSIWLGKELPKYNNCRAGEAADGSVVTHILYTCTCLAQKGLSADLWASQGKTDLFFWGGRKIRSPPGATLINTENNSPVLCSSSMINFILEIGIRGIDALSGKLSRFISEGVKFPT